MNLVSSHCAAGRLRSGKFRKHTGKEGPDGYHGAEVGVGGHVDRGDITRAHAQERQRRREQHVPHGQRDGVGEAVVSQDPLVVQDDRARQRDP